MTEDFDIIVIGKGLIGSAAAKYFSLQGKKTAVIGADEPAATNSPLVYASHYDQARIQRIVGKDAAWTKLNFDSVQQYSAIQKESGVNFHTGVGCLYVNPYGTDEYLKQYKTLVQSCNISYSFLENIKNTDKYFDGFSFPEKSVAVMELSPAGYINPLLLIEAQLNIFKKNGGLIITDTVTDVETTANKTFIVKTVAGQSFSAKNVLVATGSFINYFNILPKKLKLKTKSEVVLLVKVEEDMLPHYSKLPSLLYEINEEGIDGIYMIQPVQYPDGNYYLKIGCNLPGDIYFESLEQIQDWFTKGNSERYEPILVKAISKILPSLNVENISTKKCIISRTEHGRPYIGETSTKGLFLAGGCNGYSAMCSDAIGNVASHIVLNGVMPLGYTENVFSILYEE